MKALQKLFVLGFFLTAVSTGFAQPKLGGSPVPYRVLPGTTLSLQFTDLNGQLQSHSSGISGTFSLSRQLSPLDWDVYHLGSIQWTLDDPFNLAAKITGTGTYSVSVRFGNTKNLTLNLQIDGHAVTLESGTVPNDQNWPFIDITVKGSTPSNQGRIDYSLHLMAAPQLQVWHYRLLESSSFLDDCPICDRLSIPHPMRGSFDLVLIDENPISSRYVLAGIDFVSTWEDQTRSFDGNGTFQLGGEVALQQSMTLQLRILSPTTTEFKTFTNTTTSVQKHLPIIEVDLDETTGQPGHFYRLHLLAAPLREIWFSTVANFTSANDDIGNKKISNGDVLSDRGEVVERSLALMRSFGLNPDITAPIDAFTVVPGGDVQFSLNSDFDSKTAGQIQNGDILSMRGQIVRRNQDLLAPFGLMPTPPDVGLDALQVLDDGEILFSISQTAFSETKNVTLHPGDLLSSKGEIRRTNQQLLAAFHPDTVSDDHDYGLDALYVWPSGEIWFSTAEGFNDQQFGSISDGDLLSNQGYIVFRGLELINAFHPLEKIANFGLDGLYIVTDVTPSLPTPHLRLQPDRANQLLDLNWEAKGHVFQVEQTPDLALPFTPVSLILPGTNWIDSATFRLDTPAFYRLRQW